jgi:hypothetical protein
MKRCKAKKTTTQTIMKEVELKSKVVKMACVKSEMDHHTKSNSLTCNMDSSNKKIYNFFTNVAKQWHCSLLIN